MAYPRFLMTMDISETAKQAGLLQQVPRTTEKAIGGAGENL